MTFNRVDRLLYFQPGLQPCLRHGKLLHTNEMTGFQRMRYCTSYRDDDMNIQMDLALPSYVRFCLMPWQSPQDLPRVYPISLTPC